MVMTAVPLDDGRARRYRDLLSLGDVAAPPGILPAGRMFARYRIGGILGRGAMGVVYRAADTELGRDVALKVLTLQGPISATIEERFLREGRAAARLQGPHLVHVYDVGQADGAKYIAMELVDGGALDDLPLPENEDELRSRIHLIEKVARALDRVHRERIVHRDVKPANILIDRMGEPRIADFGLARLLDDDQALTRSKTVLGTPMYMSPEQIRGDLAAVDGRSDIYSLGVILYESITGVPPFRGRSTQETFDKALREDPAPPRRAGLDVPPSLERICLKAIRRERDQRYATAGEFADDLARYLSGRAVSARPVPATIRFVAAVRRRPMAVVAAVGAILGITGAIIAIRSSSRASQFEAGQKVAVASGEDAMRRAREYAAKYAEAAEAWLRYRRAADERVLVPQKLAELLTQATRAAERAGEAGPQEAGPWVLLGDCRRQAGDDDRALEAWEKALRLDPEAVGALAGRSRAHFEMYFSRAGRSWEGGSARSRDLPAKEAEATAQLLKRAKADLDAVRKSNRPEPVNARILEALGHLADGRIRESIETFSTYLADAPGDAEAWYIRGQAHLWIDDARGALPNFDRALAIRERALWYVGRAVAREAAQDRPGAIADCTRALEIEPRDWQARMNRGSLRLRTGDAAGAIEDLDKAIELDPDAAIAYQNRGSARRQVNDLDGAMRDFDSAIRLEGSPASYFNRGNLFIARHETDRALQDYTKALELDPNFLNAFLMRGRLRVSISKTPRYQAEARELVMLAILDFEKAKALPGAMEDLRQALTMLDSLPK